MGRPLAIGYWLLDATLWDARWAIGYWLLDATLLDDPIAHSWASNIL